MTKKKLKKRSNIYWKLIGILLAVLIIIVSLTYVFYNVYMVLDYKEVYAEVKIGKSIGLNGDPDALWFGVMPPGSKSTRNIIISFPQETRVQIKVEGNISELIIVDKNDFILEKNTTETLEFKTIAPADAEYTKYNGIVKIYFLRTSFLT